MSPSTLSRSMATGAVSRDVAARVNEFLEEATVGMPDKRHIDSHDDAEALRQALHLLQEFGKIAPFLEGALLRAVRDDNAEDAR